MRPIDIRHVLWAPQPGRYDALLEQPAWVATGCARPLVHTGELCDHMLIQLIHGLPVAPRLPLCLLQRLDVRHVGEEGALPHAKARMLGESEQRAQGAASAGSSRRMPSKE